MGSGCVKRVQVGSCGGEVAISLVNTYIQIFMILPTFNKQLKKWVRTVKDQSMMVNDSNGRSRVSSYICNSF